MTRSRFSGPVPAIRDSARARQTGAIFGLDRYRERARARGLDVSLNSVDGGDHDMIQVPAVLERILASMPD